MKRVENSGGEPAERQEDLREKLKKGALLVGKRGGQTTPILLPSWRLFPQIPAHVSEQEAAQDSTSSSTSSIVNKVVDSDIPQVSARKLAAVLWELDQYSLPIAKMYQGNTAPPTRLRRHQNHQHHSHRDPSPSHHDQPESASSLRRHVAASLMQHHRAIQRDNHAIKPALSESIESSMEVAPYNPAMTPTSSVDYKGGIGESSYSLKTSTELLKVLNRIWSLEEQHASNISLVKALKKELDHARAKIKELARDHQVEMDELMRQIAEDKLVRMSKEHDKINAAVQSVRGELEDERKLRKRSESLHRKLAKELYEVKTSLANSLKDLEKERKSRKLLEGLCDEFSWEIRDYEQEVHALKQNSEKAVANGAEHDRLILHLSESWLDERIQMNFEYQSGLGENKSIVDKLTSEIESYLQSKQNDNRRIHNNLALKDPTFRWSSLESIPLNATVSAPQVEGDEGDSTGSDSHCFELDKPVATDLKPEVVDTEQGYVDPNFNPHPAKKTLSSKEKAKGRHPSSLQVKFEEQMAQAIYRNGAKNQDEDTEQGETTDGIQVEVNLPKKSEAEATVKGGERKNQADGFPESSSNYIDNLIQSHYLLSENGNSLPDNEYGLTSGGNSVRTSHASPVRQWTVKLPSQELSIPESSSKLPLDLKDNTLKEKLLEARTRGQRSRSRLKSSKLPFRLDQKSEV